MREDTAARIAALEKAAERVQEEFETAFSWEQRKLIAAQPYYSERLALAKASSSMAQTQGPSVAVAARAGFVCRATAENWMNDHVNNEGYFSPSFWGGDYQLASLCGDVETQRWARAWVIDNMGHRNGEKNKVAKDFNGALHAHLGFEWDRYPLKPAIADGACRKLLHSLDAEWGDVKQGNTHNDTHGKSGKGQRPAFLSLYQQLYARGPNFLLVGDTLVDKDSVIGTSDLNDLNKHLLNDPACIGPRGLHMGGRIDPYAKFNILPFAKKIDFPGRIWIIMVHDEACVHALKGESKCWFIRGVDMGDIPPKSEGEFEHLAELDCEHEGGCISLDGTVGQISRTELKEYIAAKREGRVVKVPRWASVRMHGGAGGEGYWLGDDSAMQFELIIDIFDVRFNMPWIENALEATTSDLAQVTDEMRAKFPFGLAVQGDRSQGHLKMASDCTNANKIQNRPGGKQPHFRHTFAPLPQGHTHWRQCRVALCSELKPGTPDCEECKVAVEKHGHQPDFQSVGRKGAEQVLKEMGDDISKLKQEEWMPILKGKPNWMLEARKSQIQELFEARGHFFLIGAACHAELASKEHGWERLKRKVKPYVDGTLTTLRGLIASVLPTITQRERLLDNARCRRVMQAYRICDERGEVATADKLQLWEREHSKHRDVHVGELAALQLEAGIAVPEKHEKVLQSMQSKAEMDKRKDAHFQKAQKEWQSKKKKMQRLGYQQKDPEKFKADNKQRKDRYNERVAAGDVHKESDYIRQNRRL